MQDRVEIHEGVTSSLEPGAPLPQVLRLPVHDNMVFEYMFDRNLPVHKEDMSFGEATASVVRSGIAFR